MHPKFSLRTAYRADTVDDRREIEADEMREAFTIAQEFGAVLRPIVSGVGQVGKPAASSGSRQVWQPDLQADAHLYAWPTFPSRLL